MADDPLVRRTRCGDCAFTPGTEANNSPLTRVKVEDCVATATLFYCHRNALDTDNLSHDEAEALCAGWLQAVTAKMEGGELLGIESPDYAERTERLEAIERVEDHILSGSV